jgi:RNA polymerase sigma-70 factor (ECF subfamily)
MDTTAFEAQRPRLTTIAARILGATSEADDVVQEAWLRLARTEVVDDPAAWLTTVVTRLCLDQLRKRQTRAAAEAAAPVEVRRVDPEADAVLADQVGGAMQIVIDALAPAERAAFVLHDVFGYPFEQISEVLGRSESAARKLASRARRKVQGSPETVEERAARAESREVIDAFLDAAHGGDLATLLGLLAPDAVMRPDLAGRRMGAEAVYEGAASVAERFQGGAQGARQASIDGDAGLAWIVGGEVKVVFAFQIEGGLVREVELIADPEVLATMHVVPSREES